MHNWNFGKQPSPNGEMIGPTIGLRSSWWVARGRASASRSGRWHGGHLDAGFQVRKRRHGKAVLGGCNYPEVAMAAITEMYRQVGNLTVDESGIAWRGLIIRHLVLPNNIAGTEKFLSFVGGMAES